MNFRERIFFLTRLSYQFFKDRMSKIIDGLDSRQPAKCLNAFEFQPFHRHKLIPFGKLPMRQQLEICEPESSENFQLAIKIG